MNKEAIKMQELEFMQRGLAIWGKVTPELFTFENRKDKETVRHG